MIALHQDNPRLHRAIFDEAPAPAIMRASFERMDRVVRERAAEVLRVSGWPPERADLAAYVLSQVLETLTHRFVLNPLESVSTYPSL